MYSISWKLYLKLQMKGWLTYSSIRRSRMMLRTLSDRTTVVVEGRISLGANRLCDQGQALCGRDKTWSETRSVRQESRKFGRTKKGMDAAAYLHLCGCT